MTIPVQQRYKKNAVNLPMAEIKSIDFSILSPEDIRRISVCQITNPKPKSLDRLPGSLCDPRMGAIERGEICETCCLRGRECQGHFGHITLAEPVLNPLISTELTPFFRNFCFQCGVRKVVKSKVSEWISDIMGEDLVSSPSQVTARDNAYCPDCTEQFYAKYSIKSREFSLVDEDGNSRILESHEIYSFLCKIDDSELADFGRTSETHPKYHMFIDFPVMPPCARPYTKEGSRIRLDTTTDEYGTLHRKSELLARCLGERRKALDEREDEIAESLNDAIYTHRRDIRLIISKIYDSNLAEKFRSHGSSLAKQPSIVLSIKERLSGKSGRLRGHIQGKRVDFSGRDVISPNPLIDVDQIGVPRYCANILTVPVQVTRSNISNIQKMLKNGEAVRLVRGKKSFDLKNAMCTHKLHPGDIIERKLKDNDRIFLNRQPTLHKGSFFGLRVKVHDGHTLQLNLAVTSSYNADFDGDEMNMHVPQNELARAEMTLASVEELITSDQQGFPNLGIVQDGPIGAYLLCGGTHEDQRDGGKELTREDFFQILTGLDWETSKMVKRMAHVRERIRVENVPFKLYSGKGIISCILPPTLDYSLQYNAGGRKIDLIIRKGLLISGTFAKTVLHRGSKSLIKLLTEEYSSSRAMEFVNDLQRMSTAYLSMFGFSIGLADCRVFDEDTQCKVNESIARAFSEAFSYESTQDMDPLIREEKTVLALNAARDVGQAIARDSLKRDNSLRVMIESGSKGNHVNVAQITGLLGQQCLNGARAPKQLSSSTRTLSCYHDYDAVIAQQPEKIGTEYIEPYFESRGFIQNSFIKGLNPKEYFFHACSGREGIADTVCKTPDSGYLHRKLVKTSENLVVRQDRTVRNDQGDIIQFLYGCDGLDVQRRIYLADKTHGFIDLPRFLRREAYEGPSESPSPSYMCEIVSVITQEYYQHVHDEIASGLLEELARKLLRQIIKFGITHLPQRGSENYYDMLTKLEKRFRQSLAEPGKSVGVIAAQSVCAPTTQMVLNTFHSAGVANKKATLGLPRVKALFDLTRTDAGIQVHLKPPAKSLVELQERTKSTFRRARLGDLMLRTEIKQLDPSNEIWWHKLYADLDSSFGEQIKERTQRRETYLVVHLDSSLIADYNLHPEEIVYRLQKGTVFDDLSDTSSNDEGFSATKAFKGSKLDIAVVGSLWSIAAPIGEFKLHVFARSPEDMQEIVTASEKTFSASEPPRYLRFSTSEEIEAARMDYYFRVLVTKSLRYVLVAGPPKMSSCFPSEMNDGEWVLQTVGGDYHHIISKEGVDGKRSHSDTPLDVLETLGIEAARSFMIQELERVIGYDGTIVARTHIGLIIDNMTRTGNLLASNRHGHRKNGNSPLTRASFEEAIKGLMQSAHAGKSDELNSLSAAITMGKLAYTGTGMSDILLDAEKLISG